MGEQSAKSSILETMKDNKYIKEYRELFMNDYSYKLINNKKREDNIKTIRQHINVMFIYLIWRELKHGASKTGFSELMFKSLTESCSGKNIKVNTQSYHGKKLMDVVNCKVLKELLLGAHQKDDDDYISRERLLKGEYTKRILSDKLAGDIASSIGIDPKYIQGDELLFGVHSNKSIILYMLVRAISDAKACIESKVVYDYSEHDHKKEDDLKIDKQSDTNGKRDIESYSIIAWKDKLLGDRIIDFNIKENLGKTDGTFKAGEGSDEYKLYMNIKPCKYKDIYDGITPYTGIKEDELINRILFFIKYEDVQKINDEKDKMLSIVRGIGLRDFEKSLLKTISKCSNLDSEITELQKLRDKWGRQLSIIEYWLALKQDELERK